MASVAFVTYRALPQLTSDDRAVCARLQGDGVSARAVAWDTPDVSWADYDAIVVRSCWDYHLQPGAFLAWLAALEQIRAPIWNPAPLLRWNLHKSYLRDLQAQGVAIPPTCWLARGAQAELGDLMAERGWEQAVVKPAISATAYGTWRTTRAQAPRRQARFAAQLQQTDLLVQRFSTPVVTDGEWSLMFFQKRFSHAVLKKAKSGDFRVQDDFGGTVERATPDPALIDQAERILSRIDGPLLYARVDGVAQDGQFVLMELELIEPYLFLGSEPSAAERFAEAIRAALP